jgi:hypothetical protein
MDRESEERKLQIELSHKLAMEKEKNQFVFYLIGISIYYKQQTMQ